MRYYGIICFLSFIALRKCVLAMRIDQITVGDIMQRQILYFDAQVEDICSLICRELMINNMPSLQGKTAWVTEGQGWKEKLLHEQMVLSPDTRLLEPGLANRFEKASHNVLFVFSGDMIRGVVHISDFNHPVVIKALQDDVSDFEQLLRKWLLLHGHTQQQVFDYVEENAKTAKQHSRDYWIQRYEALNRQWQEGRHHQVGELRLFYLIELLEFGITTYAYTESQTPFEALSKSDAKKLNQLRNTVMHAGNPIERDQAKLFSDGSLHEFLRSIQLLKKCQIMFELGIWAHKVFTELRRKENLHRLQLIKQHPEHGLDFLLRS